LLGMKPGHACAPTACLSGVHLLTGATINHVVHNTEGKGSKIAPFVWTNH
jgi:hypothetical protein